MSALNLVLNRAPVHTASNPTKSRLCSEHVCVNLVTAANDKCQNGTKFVRGRSTGAKPHLYRTEKKPGAHTDWKDYRRTCRTQVVRSSDVFNSSNLSVFCVTHGLTTNVSGEEANETLHGNLALQPYNCKLCINSFSTTETVG